MPFLWSQAQGFCIHVQFREFEAAHESSKMAVNCSSMCSYDQSEPHLINYHIQDKCGWSRDFKVQRVHRSVCKSFRQRGSNRAICAPTGVCILLSLKYCSVGVCLKQTLRMMFYRREWQNDLFSYGLLRKVQIEVSASGSWIPETTGCLKPTINHKLKLTRCWYSLSLAHHRSTSAFIHEEQPQRFPIFWQDRYWSHINRSNRCGWNRHQALQRYFQA